MGVSGDWKHKSLTVRHVIEEAQMRTGHKESGQPGVEGVRPTQTKQERALGA